MAISRRRHTDYDALAWSSAIAIFLGKKVAFVSDRQEIENEFLVLVKEKLGLLEEMLDKKDKK